MLFINQEERRASNTVLFTSENNDIANQSVDTSFSASQKNPMTNQLASLARRDYFYLDAFWRVNHRPRNKTRDAYLVFVLPPKP